jgi:DNA-binding transcriptional MocR family regulator
VDDVANRVRLSIYRRFIEAGAPPPAAETAETLDIPLDQVERAYRTLADEHVIVLEPGTVDVWLANPLSARPTAFRVDAGSRGRWWGSCVWDALGVLAMLDADGTVSTRCADCEEPLGLAVKSRRLMPSETVGHFLIPAADWWEDIGFT